MPLGPTVPSTWNLHGSSAAKGNFEELSFKLKADLSLMNASFKTAMDKVEENLELEVFEAYFNGPDGQPEGGELVEVIAHLQWIPAMLCA